MLLFIVPIFKKMYADLGGKLPPATQVLITLSNICVHAMPLVIVAVIGSHLRLPAVGAHRGRQGHPGPAGPAGPDLRRAGPQDGHGPLRVHPVHPAEARAFRSSSRSRSPPTRSRNAVVADGVHAISDGAKRGEPLTRPLQSHPVFPPMVTQMMAVGEETGALDSLLQKVADFFEEEVQRTVDSPHLDARAAADRRARQRGRRHGHLAVPADVRHHQAGRQQQLSRPAAGLPVRPPRSVAGCHRGDCPVRTQ